MSSSDEEPAVKRRKGISHAEQYERNVIKNARVHGLQYKNYKGTVVQQKLVPEQLICKCKAKCYLHIDDDNKNLIWNNFYKLDTKNTQDTYLHALIESRPIVRRRPKKPENQDDVCSENNHETPEIPFKKNHSFVYNVKINGVFKPVCKNIFQQVHGVSRDRVSRLCNLLVHDKLPVDKRGQNHSGNAIEGNICMAIHDHICRFEVKETHYGGTLRKYLDGRLTTRKMYDMFMLEHPELDKKVKYSFYYTYFKENFNYSFGRPQVDVCSQCENFSAKLRDRYLSDNAKRNVAAEQMVHKRRVKKFYEK